MFVSLDIFHHTCLFDTIIDPSAITDFFTVIVLILLICAKIFTEDSNIAITITIFDNDFIFKILINYR